MYVICDMLGVPAADRDRFSYWSDTLLNLTRYSQAEIEAAQAEFFQYMSDHVAAKRAEPGEDLLSELIAVGGPEDGGLSDLQILVTGMALLVAGHETTANMIGKMVAMLLADRSRWERLLADPRWSAPRWRSAAVRRQLRLRPAALPARGDRGQRHGRCRAAPPWCAAWPRPTATRASSRPPTRWT